MVVKVYISGISGNKEVKKRQQRVLLILDSRNIKYDIIDIAEPDNEAKKDFMQNNSTALGSTIGDPNPRHPLPPQIFSDDVYCGDYDQFDMANEIDEMEKFLKMAPDDSTVTSNAEVKLENGDVADSKVENGETKEDAKEEENKADVEKVDSSETENKENNENEGADKTDETEINEDAKEENDSGDHKAEADNVENQKAEADNVENGKEAADDVNAEAGDDTVEDS